MALHMAINALRGMHVHCRLMDRFRSHRDFVSLCASSPVLRHVLPRGASVSPFSGVTFTGWCVSRVPLSLSGSFLDPLRSRLLSGCCPNVVMVFFTLRVACVIPWTIPSSDDGPSMQDAVAPFVSFACHCENLHCELEQFYLVYKKVFASTLSIMVWLKRLLKQSIFLWVVAPRYTFFQPVAPASLLHDFVHCLWMHKTFRRRCGMSQHLPADPRTDLVSCDTTCAPCLSILLRPFPSPLIPLSCPRCPTTPRSLLARYFLPIGFPSRRPFTSLGSPLPR